MNAIETAKAEFLQVKSGLAYALACTPDDRLHWSPSPSARNALHLVAHSANSIGNLHGMLQGIAFTIPTPTEADAYFLEQEKGITTREQAMALLDEKADAFVAWLDTLSEERLGDPVKLPFDLGSAPIGLVITFPGRHAQGHLAQLEYLQTIYGDRDWHMS